MSKDQKIINYQGDDLFDCSIWLQSKFTDLSKFTLVLQDQPLPILEHTLNKHNPRNIMSIKQFYDYQYFLGKNHLLPKSQRLAVLYEIACQTQCISEVDQIIRDLDDIVFKLEIHRAFDKVQLIYKEEVAAHESMSFTFLSNVCSLYRSYLAQNNMMEFGEYVGKASHSNIIFICLDDPIANIIIESQHAKNVYVVYNNDCITAHTNHFDLLRFDHYTNEMSHIVKIIQQEVQQQANICIALQSSCFAMQIATHLEYLNIGFIDRIGAPFSTTTLFAELSCPPTNLESGTFYEFLNYKTSTIDEASTEINQLQDILNNIKNNMHFMLFNCTQTSYTQMFENIFGQLRFYKQHNSNNAQVVLANPATIDLYKFDIVIIGDFNQDKWGIRNHSPWLKYADMELLGFKEKDNKKILDNILRNNKVVITRSDVNDSGLQTLPKICFEYMHLALHQNIARIIHHHSISHQQDAATCSHKDFPTKLSVSAIEMLMRNPYVFHAKYILGLRPINQNQEHATVGVFVHECIDKYTKMSQKQCIKLIASENKERLFAYKDIAWYRCVAILEAFVQFDNSRKKGVEVFSEVYGQTEIMPGIVLFGIADRIEVDEDGAVIIDYKTGSVPTNSEIQQGLSPQLVLLKFILQNGGFKHVKTTKCKEIAYVGLRNDKAIYTPVNVDDHQVLELIKKRLQYFTDPSQEHIEYPYDQDDYPDYKHLAR